MQRGWLGHSFIAQQRYIHFSEMNRLVVRLIAILYASLNTVRLQSSRRHLDDVLNHEVVIPCSWNSFSTAAITFSVSRRRCKMYCGHARLCVCLSVCPRPHTHYCTDPDVTCGRGRGCPLVVHYWEDLQSGHGLRCYGNITRTRVTSLRPSSDMTT